MRNRTNPLPENSPLWEEMGEVMVPMEVDAWEIYVKETRPKGQRLPNEVREGQACLSHLQGEPKACQGDQEVANLTIPWLL